MATFESETVLPAETATAFDWHEAPGALQRLIPPWEDVSVESATGGIRDGAEVVLRIGVGPASVRLVARHEGYEPPHQFVDVQEEGPFRCWRHVHSFRSHGQGRCLMRDSIEYEPPTPYFLDTLASQRIDRKLQAMFAYRHRTTRDDLRFHGRYSQDPKTLAVSGSTGLVGSTLCPLLTTGGHRVVRLVRSEPEEAVPGCEARRYDPDAATLDASVLDGCDAVIHLAGESIMGRWDEEKKRRIRESRVHSTRIIAEAMAARSDGPRTLVVASAIGIYGDRGDETLTEDSSHGSDFLADVAREWEQAADAARNAGIRVVHVRLGIVLSPRGGALSQTLLPFKLGGGVQIGDGQQWWSWVGIDDAAGIFAWAALDNTVHGPVNAAAPGSVRNRQFTETLAEVLSRPTWPGFVRIPGPAATLAMGEMADALLLSSARVEPQHTQAAGYEFRFTNLEETLRHVLGRT